jgi:GNAT superfamily N-acetyltransferase
MSVPLQIRVLTRSDFQFALRLCRLAGWNQTRDDWQRLWALEPKGCFVAEWEGEPVGTVTTTSYGTDLAWIGMMLVHPDHRRKGIGRVLMIAALDYLRNAGVRCIKLDATPLGKKVYDTLGFKDEWTLARWEHANVGELRVRQASGVRTLKGTDRALVQHWDKEAFGTDRLHLLERLAQSGHAALVHGAESGSVDGFGLIRAGTRAAYLGPVVATTPEGATAVIEALLACSPNQKVFWDIPDLNAAAVDLAKRLGFAPVRQLIRMFLGENSCRGQTEKIFALAGPEVG